MPGITYDPTDFPGDITPAVPTVLRLNEDGSYTYLPFLEVVAIGVQEGKDPGSAQLRYKFDDEYGYPFPSSIAQILPSNSPGPTAVRIDDRIVIAVVDPYGQFEIIFDGFAQIPQGSIGDGQEGGLQVIATPVRCWDGVVKDAIYRDGSQPDNASRNFFTNLKVDFNPGGIGNKTPHDSPRIIDPGDGSLPTEDPVFLDPGVATAEKWTIADAVTHLLVQYNDGFFVQNPDLTVLGFLLDALQPSTPGGFIDPADASTYTTNPIYVADRAGDATGKVWPDAVWDIINPHGFTFIWRLDTGSDHRPSWILDILRSSQADAIDEKVVKLQPRGEDLDPARSNVNQLTIARDGSAIVNGYYLTPEIIETEASFMLAPMFELASSDTTVLESFKKTAPDFDEVRNLYRWFGVDELGEGHWVFGMTGLKTTLPDLSEVFDSGNGDPYVPRYRKAARKLISKGPDGRTLTGQLSWIPANQYTGPVPGVWDKSAADKFIPIKGGWKLDDDRLAIHIDCEDPSQWSYGDHSSLPRAGVIPIVEWLNDSTKRFHLRLTVRVEGDFTNEALADRRDASPTAFPIRRMIDARSRYKPMVIGKSSEHNDSTSDVNAVDFSAEATADVMARRYATEMPPFAGPITIPYFTNSFKLGDRIRAIEGIGLSFAPTASLGEGPCYPRVVGIEWTFSDGERTTLHLSDRRVGREKSYG